ncbi:hypothetical protein [Undibacterium curvum]|uniref:hypothetical protein n=1 Tax=Undibacterium curvum TaxID=2762294 RepID=UPI003D128878
MTKPSPDRSSLQAVYDRLKIKQQSLDDMLKNPALKRTLENAARNHAKRLARFDPVAARCKNDD